MLVVCSGLDCLALRGAGQKWRWNGSLFVVFKALNNIGKPQKHPAFRRKMITLLKLSNVFVRNRELVFFVARSQTSLRFVNYGIFSLQIHNAVEFVKCHLFCCFEQRKWNSVHLCNIWVAADVFQVKSETKSISREYKLLWGNWKTSFCNILIRG